MLINRLFSFVPLTVKIILLGVLVVCFIIQFIKFIKI